jgi:hypothetical protein
VYDVTGEARVLVPVQVTVIELPVWTAEVTVGIAGTDMYLIVGA